MPARLVAALTVPAAEGRSFAVRRGQQLRVIAVEGPQAADLVALNAEDPRESLSTWLTRQQSGSFLYAERFYSKLPAGRVMFTLDSAPPGCFWLSPGRCNRLTYARRGHPDHANCQDILAATLAPHGIGPFDVPEVLNLFMRPQLRPDGTYAFQASPVQAGDYVAFRAELDLLVAVAACPDDAAYNAGFPKPVAVEIWEPSNR
jgi:uncharacterized protein YcgI (DUF1989 family)